MDTIHDDCDLLSEEDIDGFIIKVDALDAPLDSLHGKSDHGEVEERRKNDESSRDLILLHNHRQVVCNVNLHLPCCRTIRNFCLPPASCSVPAWLSHPSSVNIGHSLPARQQSRVATTSNARPNDHSGTNWDANTPTSSAITQHSNHQLQPSKLNTISPASTVPGFSEIVEEDNDDSVVDVTPCF